MKENEANGASEPMQDVYRHLEVMSVTQSDQEKSYITILKECDGTRMMPVLMERSEAALLLLKMKYKFLSSTPMNFPEIMLNAFYHFNIRLKEVRICAVRAGITYCHLVCEQYGDPKIISYCRAAEGIVLAVTFRCPITIHETLLEQQYMREVAGGTYSMPINSVSKEALEEALKKAVAEENYELASLLRDELLRRK